MIVGVLAGLLNLVGCGAYNFSGADIGTAQSFPSKFFSELCGSKPKFHYCSKFRQGLYPRFTGSNQ